MSHNAPSTARLHVSLHSLRNPRLYTDEELRLAEAGQLPMLLLNRGADLCDRPSSQPWHVHSRAPAEREVTAAAFYLKPGLGTRATVVNRFAPWDTLLQVSA